MDDIRHARGTAEIPPKSSRLQRLWENVLSSYGALELVMKENSRLIRANGDLFLGAALSLIGFFNFQSGKYCDGNTADYLSCTRPVTYYYYGAFDIFVIVVGVFFVLLWILKRRGERGR